MSTKDSANLPPARIAVIGAAWWSQGWHMPQLQRNPDAEIAAIMQRRSVTHRCDPCTEWRFMASRFGGTTPRRTVP